MTKTTFKLISTFQRQAARIEAGLPANALATFPALVSLQSEIHAEVAPTLAAMRDVDDFIASGKSLVAWTKEKVTPAYLPAWARLQPEPLPLGLPMPPNTCFNPAFAV